MAFSIARDERSAAFFEGAAHGSLIVGTCPTCGRAFSPYIHKCAVHGVELEPSVGAGTATLITWAVDVSPPLDPLFATPDGTGTCVAMVELAEGPWMYAAIVGVDPVDLRADMPLQVRFVRPGDGETVPVFTPA